MSFRLPTINAQPREGKSFSDYLEVQEVFDTIQGEGPFAGIPALFVRFAGCNMQCERCDTDYTSKRYETTVAKMSKDIQGQKRQLVVLTGGEPLRQNLSALLNDLLASAPDLTIQMETNGTFSPDYLFSQAFNILASQSSDSDRLRLHLVISPKSAASPWSSMDVIHKFRGEVSFKYPIAAGLTSMDDGLPTRVLGTDYKPARPPSNFPLDRIFVTPEDSGDKATNQANLDHAAEICLKFGYRFGVQLHKLAGLK